MRHSASVAAVLVSLLATAPALPQGRREGAKVAASQIVESVKRKQWAILEQPGLLDPSYVPALVPLLDDPDPQVRELTVQCLAAAGGPAAAQGLMKALDDAVETVGAAAVRGLARHYTAAEIPAIRAQMSTNRNEYVREQLALLLGGTGDPANIPLLNARKPSELDERARHAASLAMARLGDAGSKSELRARLLQQASVAQRVAALRDLPYVNDRALLAEASPLLDDQRPGRNIGPSHGRYLIRVCDVVVTVMAEMLGAGALPFDTRPRRFTPEELAQARQVLSQVR